MRHFSPHGLAVLLATAVTALVAAGPATAAAVCGEGMYAYAGFDVPSATTAVRATIGQAGPLDVRAGHVAGWIGVVAPNTDDTWLQAGLSALPGDTTSQIYYELALPGRAPVYRDVRRFIGPSRPHRFGVLEIAGRPSWWRIWVDGQPVTAPIHLRGSHDRWTAEVLGESWAGTETGSCNVYSYAFTHVSLLPAGSGRRAGLPRAALDDPNYVVAHRTGSSFLATTRR